MRMSSSKATTATKLTAFTTKQGPSPKWASSRAECVALYTSQPHGQPLHPGTNQGPVLPGVVEPEVAVLERAEGSNHAVEGRAPAKMPF